MTWSYCLAISSLGRVGEHGAEGGGHHLFWDLGTVGDPLRCVRLLTEHNCFVTRGNHERWAAIATMRDWDAPKLADLPPAVGARVAGLPLTVCFTSPAGWWRWRTGS